jgi:hypothetical protein
LLIWIDDGEAYRRRGINADVYAPRSRCAREVQQNSVGDKATMSPSFIGSSATVRHLQYIGRDPPRLVMRLASSAEKKLVF